MLSFPRRRRSPFLIQLPPLVLVRLSVIGCFGKWHSWAAWRNRPIRSREWCCNRRRDWQNRTRSRAQPCWRPTPEFRRDSAYECKNGYFMRFFHSGEFESLQEHTCSTSRFRKSQSWVQRTRFDLEASQIRFETAVTSGNTGPFERFAEIDKTFSPPIALSR